MFNQKRQRPIGILIEGGEGNVVRHNRFSGDMDAIVFRNSDRNTAYGNEITLAPDISNFEKVRSILNDHLGELGQAKRESLYADIDEMQRTAKTADYLGAYQRFTSALSNHITILTALAPLTPWLLTQISG